MFKIGDHVFHPVHGAGTVTQLSGSSIYVAPVMGGYSIPFWRHSAEEREKHTEPQLAHGGGVLRMPRHDMNDLTHEPNMNAHIQMAEAWFGGKPKDHGFKDGHEVFHPVWGPGIVTGVEPDRVRVTFEPDTKSGVKNFYHKPSKNTVQINKGYLGGEFTGPMMDIADLKNVSVPDNKQQRKLKMTTQPVDHKLSEAIKAVFEKDFTAFEAAIGAILSAKGMAKLDERKKEIVEALSFPNNGDTAEVEHQRAVDYHGEHASVVSHVADGKGNLKTVLKHADGTHFAVETKRGLLGHKTTVDEL